MLPPESEVAYQLLGFLLHGKISKIYQFVFYFGAAPNHWTPTKNILAL